MHLSDTIVKRHLAFLLVTLLLLSALAMFSACGNAESQGTAGKTDATEAPASPAETPTEAPEGTTADPGTEPAATSSPEAGTTAAATTEAGTAAAPVSTAAATTGNDGTTAAATTAAATTAAVTTQPAPVTTAPVVTTVPVTTEAPKPVDSTALVARDGWALDIPAYPYGTLDTKKYNCGQGLTEADPTAYMQIVSSTTAKDFQNYVLALKDAGYLAEQENAVDGNLFASLYDGTHRMYCYYLNYYRQVKVISDPVSVSVKDFDFTPVPATGAEGPVMYAYGFNSTGQILLIHNTDGSWFINDGCTSSLDSEALWQFLLSKSNLAAGEKLRVSLWYITHGHSDHFPGVYNMMKKHSAEISLERCMWNFPDQGVIKPGSSSRKPQLEMQTWVKQTYPNVLYLKPHNGMTVTAGDFSLFFMATQEDNVPKFLSGEFTDYNNTSAVCMMTFCGKKIFLPGDSKQATIDGDGFMCNIYSDSTLVCQMMQVSHHGYNKMRTLHQKFYPTLEFAIYMNTYEESVGKNSGSSQAILNKLGEAKCCWSDKTYAFTVENGKFVRTVIE